MGSGNETIERYGEEQTMVRDEKGKWLGEKGESYINEDKAFKLAMKALLIGFAGGVFMSLLVYTFMVGGL